MLIKDLIKTLQDLDNSFDEEYRETIGEPTIEIDVFAKVKGFDHYQYAGFSHDINIEQSQDGTHYILSAFKRQK